jgi:hypothetical protein
VKAVATELTSLVAVQASKARSLLDLGEDDPVALDEEHVADMAQILEGRPYRRLRPPTDQRVGHV